MAETIAPTRSNLLQRREQLKLANRGADLLKRKRDALIGEFFSLVQASLKARRALNQAGREAYFSLFLAKAWDGPEAVESLSLAARTGLDLDVKVENLFGVKVPQVQPPTFDRSLPFSPVGAGARTLEAASQFRALTEALVRVAATETRLRLVGEEIKKTSRRVNALEQIVIPGVAQQIKDIRSVLDQRALEEITVLKRIKAKLDAREEAEAQEGARTEGKAQRSGPPEATAQVG
ncbi:V-type ATP synthase subunit D [Truepera radiovictrix]|uniref:V-type ATP synthase subunit D n=1 Tax=Truepera radiovictrix (strain DSM 17093 / CIP 108686 / LMG 22925 / RQ-24) TaxID=649638 RepID=D7CQZ6_TRURR|nr:V-type ATP synthase subunit D [Truepera radiovictrix]ADI15130.1 V-type ATPase, D subunit [Truepera radiovictrix DSM 17093]WMT56317.1 V-type ATP synthase subunit D [Truepera radiovictrix]